jgi:prepilin-type N-terminal cleavage/methylation domain-containing protein
VTQRSRPPRVTSAFSLIEILVVIVVIGILAAIIFAVASSSRAKADQAVTTSNMRQLAAAGALYREDFGAWPRSAAQLVRLKRVPAELVAMKRDNTEHGVAYEAAMSVGLKPKTDVRDSLPGWESLIVSPAQTAWMEQEGEASGWLVDLLDLEVPEWGSWVSAKGQYRRLTFDGAVILRQNKPFADGGPEFGMGYAPVFFFTDMTDAAAKKNENGWR